MGFANKAVVCLMIFVLGVVFLNITTSSSDKMAYASLALSPPWDANIVNIDNDPGHSFSPEIKASGNNVYVAWADDTAYLSKGAGAVDRCPAIYDILFSKSSNAGATYSVPLNLIPASGGGTISGGIVSGNPFGTLFCNDPGFTSTDITSSPQIRMAVSGDNIYLVWGEGRFSNELNTFTHRDGIFFSHSTNNGATFSAPVQLNNNTLGFDPEIGVSGNNVYVTWDNGCALGPSAANVIIDRSTNGGVGFTRTSLTGSCAATVPELGVAENAVYVAWDDNSVAHDIWLVKSSNGGASYLSSINLSHDGSAVAPQMGVSPSGTAVIIWGDTINEGLGGVQMSSTSDGVHFGPAQDLTSIDGQTTGAFDYHISVTNDSSGNPVGGVIWTNTFPVSTTVMYFDGFEGSTIQPPTRITSGNGTGVGDPAIVVSGSSAYAAWSTQGSPDETISFGSGAIHNSLIPCCDSTISATSVTANHDGRLQATLAVGQGRIYVAWHDHTTQNGGEVDVRGLTLQCPAPPLAGDWIIATSCTLASSATAPANVIVQSGEVLVIPNGVQLNIDLTHFHLIVKPGGGVLIKAGGKIN